MGLGLMTVAAELVIGTCTAGLSYVAVTVQVSALPTSASVGVK